MDPVPEPSSTPHEGSVPVGGSTPAWHDWDEWPSTAKSGSLAGRQWRVRSRDAAGPPVIVLHELFGPDEHTMTFAAWLASQGRPPFSVHVPALFGSFGESAGLLRSAWNICIRREFNIWRTGQTSPIVTWLRQLVVEVAERHGGDPSVGVVGMCMTGGVVMALVQHPRVDAIVSSQPSLPIYRAWSTRSFMGLGEEDIPPETDPEADLTVLHYEQDWLCPNRRAEGIAGTPLGPPQQVSPAVRVRQGHRGRLVAVSGKGHSVLTADLNREARALVGYWLADALSAPDGDA